MKLLLSADYHLKLNTKNIPNEWALNRFKTLFNKIHSISNSCSIHVVAGDFFDRLPTLEELELYYEFVQGCIIPTFIIPGNHEAIKKNTTFLSFLKSITKHINNKVSIIDTILKVENIDFIPYNYLKDFEKNAGTYFNQLNGDILVTHVRGEIPPYVKAEVPLELFDRWKIVLAGDLHSYDNCQRNILYPGSPITTSFHRNKVDTGVIILDTDTHEHEFVKLDLPQLIRKTIKAGEPMPATDYDHTIYEVEGDMAQLAEVGDHELMDKKVVKRSIDTALILSPEMSIEQEITEYLTYVLELPEETIIKALAVYHDNIKANAME